jgi:hypothetical protein
LRIGGVSLGVTSRSIADFWLPPEHRNFRVDSDACEIEVETEWVDRLTAAKGKLIFDSGAVWLLHEDGEDLHFDFVAPRLGDRPYKRLCVDKKFSEARLLLNRDVIPQDADIYPLEYPVDELLVTNWLVRGRGVEVHGCGLLDSEAGSNLFVGHSGAGKSTSARLWKSLRDARILSDDRLILRNQGGHTWMHGTPWHGEAGFASPEKAALKNIFILEHGQGNEITSLPQSRAIGELFARCFLPFHDPELLRFALNFLHEVTSFVPCYVFHFLPDSSAVEKILEFQDSR